MGIQIDTQKVILWDNDLHRMVPKTEVFVRVVTYKGAVMIEEGPLYCIDGKEVYDATRLLYNRLRCSLPGIHGDEHEFHDNIVDGNM
jgi:hypothetical protein